jgi:integrating conjugative element membrane protein (TIGR03747 family)
VSAVNNKAPPPQREQVREKSLLYSLVTLPFHMFGALLGALFLSILVECIGVAVFWSDQGWHHAERLFVSDLNQVSTQFKRSLLLSQPAKTAENLSFKALDWAQRNRFTKRLLEPRAEVTAPASASGRLGMSDARYWMDRLNKGSKTYMLAAFFAALVFLVRVVILILTTPLFVMAAVVGLLDGLVRRDVRKFGSGRESGFIYHRARAALIPIVVLPWVIYLALPFSFNPLLILLPAAVALFVVVNITSSKFKKYL